MSIVGVGNLLIKDEGIGVHIVHELEKLNLPEWVRVIDAGTGGLNLLYLLETASKIILVDAAEIGKTPGSFLKFTPSEVALEAKGVTSLHDLGLPQVLSLGSALGLSPEIIIFGIQPKELKWEIGLSPELAKAVPQIIGSILSEISILGPNCD